MHKLIGVVCATLALAGAKAGAQQLVTDSVLAVRAVNIIDTRTGARARDATIVVRAGIIETVGPSSAVHVPQGARLIEARGKYVIPGLWDLHVHIRNQEELNVFFPLLVAFGVLGIRDAGGLLPRDYHELGARQQYAPQVVAAGNPVDGPAPEGTADIAAVVDSLAGEGVGFVKVFSMLPRDRFLAILDRARQRGLHVAGHVPVAVSAQEASDAGMRTMEHLLEIHLAVSTQEAELRAQRLRATGQKLSHGEQIRVLAFPPLEPLLDSWSDAKATALFQRFVANQTWQDPTLVLFQAWAAAGTESFWRDPLLEYIPTAWKESWRPDRHQWVKEIPRAELPAFYAHVTRWHRAQLDLTRRMHGAGVRFLAGTDASQWNFMVPGSSLHDELALFVRAGFSPLEALQTATINPAEYLGITASAGTVAVGRRADFLLLDADPLADIRNTRRLSAVVIRGRFLDRSLLDGILKEARQRAAGKSN
jgi:imidazolonepropionase-like amidohydrolase